MTLASYLPAWQMEVAADILFCSCLTIRDLYWLKFRHFWHRLRNVQHRNNWLGIDGDNQATQQEEDSNSLQLHGGIIIYSLWHWLHGMKADFYSASNHIVVTLVADNIRKCGLFWCLRPIAYDNLTQMILQLQLPHPVDLNHWISVRIQSPAVMGAWRVHRITIVTLKCSCTDSMKFQQYKSLGNKVAGLIRQLAKKKKISKTCGETSIICTTILQLNCLISNTYHMDWLHLIYFFCLFPYSLFFVCTPVNVSKDAWNAVDSNSWFCTH